MSPTSSGSSSRRWIRRSGPSALVLTIGHSTRSLDELVDLLRRHSVGLLADVRSIPASRRMPHFAKAALEKSLPDQGIDYVHMPELGGLRKPQNRSVNTGLHNAGFRGYADYMQTVEFKRGVDSLLSLSEGVSRRVAVMCAEAVPWRCHRSLLSDALTVRGHEVRHITGKGEPALHSLNQLAVVVAGRITYPPPDTLPI
ncbi:MAG TPA: DUF488 domain-containing protein [Candidatus Sulfotelmatobacter sp.]|nr:DUF488 domain-containing protein [Candidatus Sulfotelmatobacter sp.]